MTATTWATADLCDDHPEVRVLDPIFQPYGAVSAFCGPASTIKCHEDNSLVRQALSEAGAGRVLVIDGGGSLRCALVGDRLAAMGADNGWAGVVVYGAIRDAAVIADIQLGLRALGTMPRKSIKREVGLRDLIVTLPGATVRPGDWIYVDRDGVIVADGQLHGD